jgi:WD40 repeat protein
LRLWDAGAGTFVLLIAQPVAGAAFLPDGRRLAYAFERQVCVFELASGASRLLGTHDSVILSLASSHDGKWLATGHVDGSVVAWNTATGAARRLGGSARGDTDTVAFAPGKALLASGGDDRAVHLFDVDSGDERSLGTHRGAEVFGLAWSPDGARLASAASGDGASPFLWSLKDGTRVAYDAGQRSSPYCAAYAPDGSAFVTGHADGSVMAYSTKERTARELFRVKGTVLGLAFSPDGKRIATGGLDGVLRLNSAADGSPIR